MKITWVGHSCFKVESKGYSIVFDPSVDGMVPGIEPIREKAQLVICSHQHDDHNAVNCVTMEEGPECPFDIFDLETYHDPEQGKLRGRNKITVIDDRETKLAHFGDLGCMPTEEQLEGLKGLDVALIPVGGHFTIDGKEAAELVKAIEPAWVIPMHFRNDEAGFGFGVIGPVTGFTEEMEQVEFSRGCEVDTEELETHEGTRVLVLRPQNAKG